MLLREWEIVQTAKQGVGDCWPLVSNPQPANPQLDDEQLQALEGLLGSTNLVSVYVLFSDSTIKAATNAQQWYVTISRGRRGIRIFTPDKEQLRDNVTRSGHRPLALELAGNLTPRRGVRLWDRLHSYLLRFGRRAADTFCRLKISRRHHPKPTQTHEHKNTRVLGERSERSRRQSRTVG